jgi:adenylate cyclase class 2
MRPKQNKNLPIETEVKIRCLVNPLTDQLAIAVSLVEPRYFEDNWLLDFDDHRLASRQCTLRLRAVSGRGWLTYKLSPHEHPWLKVREEIQVALDTPASMLTILEAIGLKCVFRYQKYRTLYQATLPDGLSLDAMFDETPMGNFLELEGEDRVIAEVVRLLSIPPHDLTQTSYPTLWAEYRQARRLPPADMVFSEDQPKEG